MIKKILTLLKQIPEDAECVYCILSDMNLKRYIVLLEETEYSNYEDTYLKIVYPWYHPQMEEISIQDMSMIKYPTLSLLLKWKENKTYPRTIKDFYYYKTRTDLFIYEAVIS